MGSIHVKLTPFFFSTDIGIDCQLYTRHIRLEASDTQSNGSPQHDYFCVCLWIW